MSGGRWNYTNDVLVHEILGYYFDVGYGLDGKEHDRYLKDAIHENALADPEISGLVYDIFCLLHSYDWAESGTQTWTHIRRMWQHSRNVGSRRLELRR